MDSHTALKQKDIGFIRKKRDRDDEPPVQSIYGTKDDLYNELKHDEGYWNKIRNENIKDIIAKDKKFIFGNYTTYYYKRYLDSLKEKEINLAILNQDWFKSKRCLDIGCNVGTLTLLIALNYAPSYIEGVDIDYRLISSAIKTTNQIIKNQIFSDIIHKAENVNTEKIKGPSLDSFLIKNQNEQQTKELINEIKLLPKSFQVNLKNDYVVDSKRKNSLSNEKYNNTIQKNQVFFHQANYVGELKGEIDSKNQFDTIICLNTSKWIQLNYGDNGIKILFNNVYQQLKKGGLFIFEPQNFESYKKRAKLSKEIHDNFNNIKIRPENFIDYLQSVYRFKLNKTVTSPSNSKKVFYRVIYILEKV